MNEVLKFWFEELETKDWWVKNPELDRKIEERFGATHAKAVNGELKSWRETPEGRLAEIIVLDQFSRNIFRDKPESFKYDHLALDAAREAVSSGDDQKVDIKKRSFLYMPYMHSEDLKAHEEALVLFNQEGIEGNLDFEKKHKAIIDRFGRYPHRNKILGRQSTEEEIEFLKGPGSSF